MRFRFGCRFRSLRFYIIFLCAILVFGVSFFFAVVFVFFWRCVVCSLCFSMFVDCVVIISPLFSFSFPANARYLWFLSGFCVFRRGAGQRREFVGLGGFFTVRLLVAGDFRRLLVWCIRIQAHIPLVSTWRYCRPLLFYIHSPRLVICVFPNHRSHRVRVCGASPLVLGSLFRRRKVSLFLYSYAFRVLWVFC